MSNVHSIDAGLAFRTDNTGTYTYYGEAFPGILDAGASWRISRKTNATGAIEWAEGDSRFNKVWNSRASYSYS